MKEQIEEMVQVLARGHHEMDVAWTNYFCDATIFPKPKPEHVILAEALYNAGYRKQSENVIELPCNIGDSCYPLPRCRKPIVERKVSRITFTKRNIIIGYYENDGQYRPPLRTRTLGEDVFLTREEAEAKMKGGAE